MVFGVRSIRMFLKFLLDPYYEPLPWFMIHNKLIILWLLVTIDTHIYVIIYNINGVWHKIFPLCRSLYVIVAMYWVLRHVFGVKCSH